MSDSVRPHRWQPTSLPRPGILQARTLSTEEIQNLKMQEVHMGPPKGAQITSLVSSTHFLAEANLSEENILMVDPQDCYRLSSQ